MNNSLIDRYGGDYHKICEHITTLLVRNSKVKSEHETEFKEWMLSKEGIFPRFGICADSLVYAQCFYIRRKLLDDTQEQQHMVIVGGKVGKGKTTIASQICSLVDESYCLERVCYLPHQFFKVINTLKPGQAIHIDEGGNFFKALNTSTKASKYLGQYFQMARAKRLFIVINYDDFEKMNKEIREKADTIIYKIPNPKVNTAHKYKPYWWYKSRAVVGINNFFSGKKKIPLTHKEMLKFISFKGANHKDYPIINDLNEEQFKNNKMKYVQVFEDLMLREFDDLVAASENKVNKAEVEANYLKANEVRKMFSISDDTLLLIRRQNPEIAIKIGKQFRYHEQKIIAAFNSTDKTQENAEIS